jgi:DNA polymerase-1
MAIFRVAEDEVTPEYRRRAKIINFGILYGMTPFGLSRELGITQGEARTYIDDYFSRFPGVQGFMEKTLKSAREKGYVETLSGRRRYIRDIDSRNQGLRQAAERMAMNAPVQGSAADIIKLSMVKLWNLLSHKGMDAYMVLQVHDELILESAMAVASESAEILRSAMEEIVSLDVPLKVDLKMGDSWGNMREFK